MCASRGVGLRLTGLGEAYRESGLIEEEVVFMIPFQGHSVTEEGAANRRPRAGLVIESLI